MTLPPLKGLTLGARLQEVQDNLGWTRAEFLRQLHRLGLKTTGPALDAWKADKKQIELPNLMAIARATGYSLDALAFGPAEVSESAPLKNQADLSEYLDTIGANEADKKAILAQAITDPPIGGITRKWALQILRYSQRRFGLGRLDQINAQVDASIEQKGGKSDTFDELNDDLSEQRAPKKKHDSQPVPVQRRRRPQKD